MFRIRQSRREDVDQILEVAEHLDTVNLPAKRDHLERILQLSQASFDATIAVVDREYLFVLEDLAAGRVIGTRVPIILTSRADGVEARLASCALAVLRHRVRLAPELDIEGLSVDQVLQQLLDQVPAPRL